MDWRGNAFSYTVTVKNNNSPYCSNNTFNLQTTLPSIGVRLPLRSVNISPGTSVSTTVQINSPIGAANGFYALGIQANSSATQTISASISLNCAIYSSLGVSISANQTTYTRNQTAVITAMVSANGYPMSGVNVTFT
jgi:uncharacterized membrane protein